jgi:hypothetical protein
MAIGHVELQCLTTRRQDRADALGEQLIVIVMSDDA